ncbi:hypothetical protein [Dysgonomonas termitidis]|uniref:Phage protein n=1 Tax=Dysgonomonas termitidis TaxID=1516126 RepID=A0ABV9KQ82_9BACT
MIYQVTKDNQTLEIDDNVFFDKQPKEFRQMYQTVRIIETKDVKGNVITTMQTNNAEFDNCFVEVFENGRVIVTLKQDKDATI